MLNLKTCVVLGAGIIQIAVPGCGDEPVPISAGGDAAVAVPDSGPAGACTDGQTQACSCQPSGDAGVRSGNQACYSGSWLLCNCQTDPLPPPTSTTGTCLPGRYEGSFKGDYRSGFAFGFGIPVEALDFSGQPGLAFTLNEQQGGNCGEFCSYTIADGYVKGTANGVYPFEGILTGELNCDTKQFTGQLEGCYALGLDLGINVGRFVGPMTGNYDGNTHSFTIGTWDVLEKDAMTGFFGEVGGNGSWNAKHNAMPTSTNPPGMPTCTGGMIDAGVAPDADP